MAEPYPSSLAANTNTHEMITKKSIIVDCNELTGEQFVKVKLIDFDNIFANSSIVINQFRIDTIGTDKMSYPRIIVPLKIRQFDNI